MALVKICGITNWGDAKAAVDAGADMLGFVCDENSPRCISPDDFCAIATRLPAHIRRVGVFGGTTGAEWRTAGRSLFHLFHQIQYTHDSLWTDILRENWDMGRKIKAFSLSSDKDLRRIAGYNGLVQSFHLNVHTAAGTLTAGSWPARPTSTASGCFWRAASPRRTSPRPPPASAPTPWMSPSASSPPPASRTWKRCGPLLRR